VDFYLDAWRAKEYGLIDEVIGVATRPRHMTSTTEAFGDQGTAALAAQERPPE